MDQVPRSTTDPFVRWLPDSSSSSIPVATWRTNSDPPLPIVSPQDLHRETLEQLFGKRTSVISHVTPEGRTEALCLQLEKEQADTMAVETMEGGPDNGC